ncbi:hypothetical protein BH09BAC1_BH09BAC1_01100 [soil metagenome]
MIKNVIKLILPLLFSFIFLGLFSYWRLCQNLENDRKKMVMQMVEEVEKFKTTYHRLPGENELETLVDESGPIYYQKEDSNSYIVYYGTSLGESKIYDSNTKSWQK